MYFNQTNDKDRIAVATWLFFIAFLVFAMVMVGGATRLTESGLSMVNWRPVTGFLPPLSDAAWLQEFTDYQASPEYKLKNIGMSLAEFKGIYWWEWAHRLLGRLIGVAFLVPMLFFWAKGRIPAGYKLRLVVLFVLGGLQGLLGWYMVKSGLVAEPEVSHYRLTAHLMLALLLFSATFWTALDLVRPHPSTIAKPIKILTHVVMLLLVLQLAMGALVAGLKAGYFYNSWPLMDGSFVPPDMLVLSPIWRNFTDNGVTVQFDHRIGAYLLFTLVLILFFKARKRAATAVKKASSYLLAAIMLQVGLGITALVKMVPVTWGTAHQGGGVLVLAVAIYLMHVQRTKSAK